MIRKLIFFIKHFGYFFSESLRDIQRQNEAFLDYTEKLNKETWPQPGETIKAEPGLKRIDFTRNVKGKKIFPAWIEENNGEYTISEKWI